jgi:hypothetical protein
MTQGFLSHSRLFLRWSRSLHLCWCHTPEEKTKELTRGAVQAAYVTMVLRWSRHFPKIIFRNLTQLWLCRSAGVRRSAEIPRGFCCNHPNGQGANGLRHEATNIPHALIIARSLASPLSASKKRTPSTSKTCLYTGIRAWYGILAQHGSASCAPCAWLDSRPSAGQLRFRPQVGLRDTCLFRMDDASAVWWTCWIQNCQRFSLR